MERMTSLGRLALVFTALLMSACGPGPSVAADGLRASDESPSPIEPSAQALPAAPAEVDGCEMVMHPCQWEEACTVPCARGAAHCCDGHWVCPGGAALARQAAVAPKGIHPTRAPRRDPRVQRKAKPRSVLTFGSSTR